MPTNSTPMLLADINTDGKLTAGIPIIEKVSLLGKRSCVSLPFTDHCAPLSMDPDGMRHFSTQLGQFIKNNPEKGFEIRWSFPGMGSLVPKQDFVLHKLTLFEDFDTNLKLIHPGSNRNARAARKHGIRIEIGKDSRHLKEFYHLHLMTRRKQGVPIQPFSFFNKIMSDILEKDLGFIMAAYQGSKCLAAALFLTWNKTITYKYGASDPGGLSLRPNDLLIQEIIRYGCEHQFTGLDLGRTDTANTGLRTYKSCWGAVEISPYLQLCTNPSANSTNLDDEYSWLSDQEFSLVGLSAYGGNFISLCRIMHTLEMYYGLFFLDQETKYQLYFEKGTKSS